MGMLYVLDEPSIGLHPKDNVKMIETLKRLRDLGNTIMPDVEVMCPTCKGARYPQETLDVKYNGKSIADVLEMSIEDAVEFFADQATVARKIRVLNDLGLGSGPRGWTLGRRTDCLRDARRNR